MASFLRVYKVALAQATNCALQVSRNFLPFKYCHEFAKLSWTLNISGGGGGGGV